GFHRSLLQEIAPERNSCVAPASRRHDSSAGKPAVCWTDRCRRDAGATDARIAAMPKSQSAAARARKIKLVLFDVDGVLTDGKLFIFPAPPGVKQSLHEHASQQEDRGGFAFLSQTLIEAKGFHAHDGTAISLVRLGGIKTGLITKRISETVA